MVSSSKYKRWFWKNDHRSRMPSSGRLYYFNNVNNEKKKWQDKSCPKMSHLQVEFLQRLTINSRHVLKYENTDLQTKAKACVPLTDLLARAQQSCSSEAKTDSQLFRDVLLIELLNWFKNSFFTWFDAAHCSTCNERMQNMGLGVPTASDVRYGAHRVENFKCSSCGATDRFPRYNDPGNVDIIFNSP